MKSLKAILSRLTCLFMSIALVALPALPMSQLTLTGVGSGKSGADISFTVVQNPVASPATCTNCSVTLTQSIGTGNILIAMANGYTNGVTISSITGQSGLVHCAGGWNKGNSNTLFSDIAYVPSTSTQASPVNVTFTGATGSTTNIQLMELSFTNGPAVL